MRIVYNGKGRLLYALKLTASNRYLFSLGISFAEKEGVFKLLLG